MAQIEYDWHGERIRRLEPGERYSVFVPADDSGTLPQIGDRVLARGRRGAEWIGTVAATRGTEERGAWVVLAEPPPWVDSAAAARAEVEALLELRHAKAREQAGVCAACGEPVEPACPCVAKERDKAAARREARLQEQAALAKEKADADAATAREQTARAALAALDDLPVDEVRAAIEDAGYDLQAAGENLGLADYKGRGTYETTRTVWAQLKGWLRRTKNAAWGPDVLRKSLAIPRAERHTGRKQQQQRNAAASGPVSRPPGMKNPCT